MGHSVHRGWVGISGPTSFLGVGMFGGWVGMSTGWVYPGYFPQDRGPQDTVGKRVVHILLEYILVMCLFLVGDRAC